MKSSNPKGSLPQAGGRGSGGPPRTPAEPIGRKISSDFFKYTPPFVSAGFCASEWKTSKMDCTNVNYCYTRDEVVQNIFIKKQTKIGFLDAWLIGMNQEFSGNNDCRSEDAWLIKAKNGQMVETNILLDSDVVRIEATQ